jgi:hypothetical protein
MKALHRSRLAPAPRPRARDWLGRFAPVALGVAALLALAVGPARATIAERGTFHDAFSDTYFDCGFPVQVDGTADGQYRIREGTAANETAFFLQSRVTWREVHSANGTSITLAGHSLYNETRAILVDGSVFEFHAIEAGQPFAIYDADGVLLLRDRGAIRHTYLFDTQGDDIPGGIFVEDVDIQFGGPHPGFELPFEDFCALFG